MQSHVPPLEKCVTRMINILIIYGMLILSHILLSILSIQ